MTPDQQRRLAALHEAGHAVAATLLGYRVDELMLYPPNLIELDGVCRLHRPPPGMSWVSEAGIVVDLAGPAAEVLHTGVEHEPLCWSSDHDAAMGTAEALTGDCFSAGGLYQRCRVRADRMLRCNWSKVDRVAWRLALWGRLSGDAVRQLVK